MSFSNGFSKLTIFTSNEWAGKLFTLLLVLRTSKGQEILSDVFSENDVHIPELEDLKRDGVETDMCSQIIQEAKLYMEAANELDAQAREEL